MRKITIEEAIKEVIASKANLNGDVIVTGFDPKKLVHIPEGSCYNHNYYEYEGTILLEIADDIDELDYFVCDRNHQRIGNVGARRESFDSSDNEICELYNF